MENSRIHRLFVENSFRRAERPQEPRMRGRVLEGHPEAERLSRANLAAHWSLFVDEPEFYRRDTRWRRLDDEPARHRVVVQAWPCAFDFF